MFYFLYRYRNCGKWRQSKFCHDYLSYKKREDENLPFSVTPEGLEPSTQWLRVICSTSWATESFAGTKVMLFTEPTKVFAGFYLMKWISSVLQECCQGGKWLWSSLSFLVRGFIPDIDQNLFWWAWRHYPLWRRSRRYEISSGGIYQNIRDCVW